MQQPSDWEALSPTPSRGQGQGTSASSINNYLLIHIVRPHSQVRGTIDYCWKNCSGGCEEGPYGKLDKVRKTVS